MPQQTASSEYLAMLRAGKAATEGADDLPSYRVAILADHSVQQLSAVLAAAIRERGYAPLMWVADYSTAPQQLFDGDSELYAFKPEVIYLSLAMQRYRERYFADGNAAAREALPASYLESTLAAIDAAVGRGHEVVVTNLTPPLERMFGNYAPLTAQSLYGSVCRFNMLLADAISKRKGLHLHDTVYLASRVGLTAYYDERTWVTSKYACATRFLPELCRSLADLLAAKMGRLAKVVVLDLDNTLWGGVVGEDGVEGIVLGGDAYGEAFQNFQRYVLALKQRGLVLAVCSKNDEQIAREVFRCHPEMVLKESDISVFVANWEDKVANIARIAETLQLSLDSFVFIDDSPFERGLVRAALPMVRVPEMPEDVAEFVPALETSGFFEATEFTSDDAERGERYKLEAQRRAEQRRFSTIDEYLASLEMRMECGSFRELDLPRIAQLIQRSNQFNLRTQRLSQAACERYMAAGVTFAARLADRFGDYGLIAAGCCEQRGNELFVVEFVMSCRVLKRGVEEYLMNHLFSLCRERGLKGVRGEIIDTAKNAIVRNFFRDFGFSEVEGDERRHVWFLDASEYRPRTTFII